MLKTPLTVLLVLRCLILLSDGEAGVSSTAESTLLRGWVISMAADMIGWLERSEAVGWLVGESGLVSSEDGTEVDGTAWREVVKVQHRLW
jgi:hypothetical protein